MSSERISTNELRRLQERDSQCAALTAERDRLKEKVALLRTRLERTNIILAQRDLDVDEWQELSEGHDLLEATK